MVIEGQHAAILQARSVTILGSTGSIGCSTLDVIRQYPEVFRVDALVANGNVEMLVRQAREFHPALVVVADGSRYLALKDALAGSGIMVAGGEAAVIEAVQRPTDWVMSAIVGAAGLRPTLEAIRRGAIVGLANKESLVCAGALMMAEVTRYGATLLPVDSEHSAIFQVLDIRQKNAVEKLVLTASGGPFRTWSLSDMARATPEQAIAHPNWPMGAKISVDSATMMNKGLELIEAFYLFSVPQERIEILIHPQSIIHSMVSYVDGSTLAQMGLPDMCTPIAHALAWPQRMAITCQPFNLADVGRLTFELPDTERFSALVLAREALRRGGTAPIVMNAANEIAVAHFLAGRIGFLDIARVIEATLQRSGAEDVRSLDDVFQCDAAGRAYAAEHCRRMATCVAGYPFCNRKA